LNVLARAARRKAKVHHHKDIETIAYRLAASSAPHFRLLAAAYRAQHELVTGGVTVQTMRASCL
jgi:uncharacterized RmlC-like cupin family protein